MAEKVWIRRDRSDGKEEEVSEEYARIRLATAYANVQYAMANCDEQSPLSTGFADYWPKPVGGSDNVKNKRSRRKG